MNHWLGNTSLSDIASTVLRGPLVGLEIASPNKLHRAIKKNIEERARFFSVKNFGVKYHSRMKIEGTDPEHFIEMVIRDKQSPAAISGIRFLGLDPGRPFVDLLPLYDIQTLAEKLPTLFRVALDHYAAFSPRQVRLTLSLSAYQYLARSFALTSDMRTLVAKASGEYEIPRAFWQECDNVVAFHRIYQEEFEWDMTDRPHMRPHREMVGLEEMRHGIESRLLGFVGRSLKKPVGFVLLEPGTVLGLRGFIIREILVFKDYRGLGYGKQLMDRALSMAGAISANTLVFSPIFNSNGESLGAATAVGFHEFITDYFMEIPEP